jgi:hypothetical protein
MEMPMNERAGNFQGLPPQLPRRSLRRRRIGSPESRDACPGYLSGVGAPDCCDRCAPHRLGRPSNRPEADTAIVTNGRRRSSKTPPRARSTSRPLRCMSLAEKSIRRRTRTRSKPTYSPFSAGSWSPGCRRTTCRCRRNTGYRTGTGVVPARLSHVAPLLRAGADSRLRRHRHGDVCRSDLASFSDRARSMARVQLPSSTQHLEVRTPDGESLKNNHSYWSDVPVGLGKSAGTQSELRLQQWLWRIRRICACATPGPCPRAIVATAVASVGPQDSNNRDDSARLSKCPHQLWSLAMHGRRR